MNTHTRHLFLVAVSLSIPLLSACGTREGTATSDSAGGTMAMTDSMGMGTQGTMNDMSTGTTDASLVSFVAMVNQAEVEAGQLASTKARNSDVKQYAQMMVDGHRKSMQDLRELSGRSGWVIPDSTSGGASGDDANMGNAGNAGGGGMMSSTMTQLQQSHQTAMQTLRAASGATFDRSYMESQVAAHQQVLDVLRQHNSSLQNAELRTRMTDMQTSVEEHLRQAQALVQKMGTTS